MSPKTRIIFRADGNSRIGLGHVVRSLALAEMLREEFECVFAIQSPNNELQEQIRSVCSGIIILPPCAPTEERYLHELDAYVSSEEIVVLDGYTFGTAYQENIKRKGAALVCIDDLHTDSFVADAIINQAGGITPEMYRAKPYTRFYLGPKYALLRKPFLEAARLERAIPNSAARLLLNMGGADPHNHTLQIARELDGIAILDQVSIVVGGAYTHLQQLQEWLQNKPRFKVYTNLSATEMRNLMQQCPIAITSPSGIAYEYCAVSGLLFVLQTADNQENLCQFLLQTGLAFKYEELQSILLKKDWKEIFNKVVLQQRHYFTGNSPEVYREVFRSLSLTTAMKLRLVNEQDLMLLYNWANDPEVRRNSFNTEPILLENHTRWFNIKLADPLSALYLATIGDDPAAHIRFDFKSETAVLSYLISEKYRGKGLGHIVLLKGIKKLQQDKPGIKQIEGLVQKSNPASVRAFEKAGFAYAVPDPRFPEAFRFTIKLDNSI
ncbi:UDP-2,4-diacetamido-2,4,6-trideoxy-beta-L-altropyranose hydrolase [Pontibacter vulgaris]|uniref:UDP-2,4-diacetamido-2,4, 6-trideoxy-beta-L-altropyranose hydrolase n=1 Tax=Pontibacter vulgaris TaxID=2905679 RepID=UPI001FA7B9D8|nr:UDP-2,4-diacetamido-2,4,6-trideoxy-beta-L-altropyranose hydrolase [Pontibacter vulgaris]